MLKELMAENNIKSDELGKILGINGSTVRRWLRGESAPFKKQLMELSSHFRCPIDYLVGRIDAFFEFKPKVCADFMSQLYSILNAKEISTYRLNGETTIKYGHLTRWRKGTEPHLQSLIELADYLECSIDSLVGFEYS